MTVIMIMMMMMIIQLILSVIIDIVDNDRVGDDEGNENVCFNSQ
jgi:hypothetical protein